MEFKCEIAYLLISVCNLTLKSTSVLEEWRVGNVTLILKRGPGGKEEITD